jgi:hypothetical protein
MVLELLQTVKLGWALVKLHWNSTTTETKEDVFIRSPAASHTFVKFLILTGMLEIPETASPGGGISTMARATSPWLENSVVLPISPIVIRGHNSDCASVKDIKANKMKGYVPL